MRVLVVLAVVGRLIRMFAVAFVPPTIHAFYEGHLDTASYFIIAVAVTLLAGFVFAPFVERNPNLRRAEALATVALTWLAIGLCGAIPFAMSGTPFIDAFFESVSGFTTTGATILTDFQVWDRSLMLWRAMSQWFGGLGIIALFVLVLPSLGIAGRQLFFAESSGAPGESLSPQVRHAAKRLWALYILLTLLLIALLLFFDVPLFDAVCHALTTLPAGGFSPHPQSVMGYANPAMEWVLAVFMLISGMSFPLLYVTLVRRPLAIARDGEFLFYAFVMVSLSLGVALLFQRDTSLDLETSLRHAFFQVSSVMSSTGFASDDFNLWGDGMKALLLIGMVIGGCAGSAAGGPKAVRFLLFFKHILRELTRVLHPRAIGSIRFKGQAVNDDTVRAVLSLVAIYMATYLIIGTLLVLDGADLITGYTAALAAVGNIGPGFNAVGPMGSFAEFSDFSKVVLTLGMWIGRLEIVTVLALLHSHVLSNLRLRQFKV